MRILLVDDFENVRRAMGKFLVGFFPDTTFEIIEAEDGKKAIKILKKGVLPDMVITDQSMPNMKGVELVAWMKKNLTTRNIPVILQSSFEVKPAEHQADEFVLKSDNDALESAIHKLGKI